MITYRSHYETRIFPSGWTHTFTLNDPCSRFAFLIECHTGDQQYLSREQVALCMQSLADTVQSDVKAVDQ